MAHRACVIASTNDLGIPGVLSKIIGEYAELSDGERLEQMFRFGSIVVITIESDEGWDIRHRLYVQDTEYGIEFSSSLTGDYRIRMDWSYFMRDMESGCILIPLGSMDESWKVDTILARMGRKLIKLWQSL